jgi:GTP cyclohydrolase I
MKISYEKFIQDATTLGNKISGKYENIYAIPRGGVPVALILSDILHLPLSETPTDKSLIVDDLIDSGKTLQNYKQKKAVLYRKPHSPHVDFFVEEISGWIDFPYEEAVKEFPDVVTRLLELVGENPTREGLVDTPKRVEKAWKFWTQGYQKSDTDVITTFENPGIDQLVIVPKIDFYSHCEHHLAPFYGQIHIGYLPGNKVLGVSKFARLTEIYTRRLQIQERIGQQIAEAVMTHLKPFGVAVVIKGIHLCMRSRGVEKQNAEMITSVMLGKFRDTPELRNEFLNLIK